MVSWVSFQDLYGRVSLQGLLGGPNILGVQISRDRTYVVMQNSCFTWTEWELFMDQYCTYTHTHIQCTCSITCRVLMRTWE